MRLIQEIADDPSIYLANSINPFRIEGQKTVAFEVMEQCEWRVPDHVVVPGGNMGNSSALGKGFEEMRQIGLIERLPKLSVIQAEGAAPLAQLFAGLEGQSKADRASIPEELTPVENPQTLATAIKIGSPVSWEKALRSVIRSQRSSHRCKRTGNRGCQSNDWPRWDWLRTRLSNNGRRNSQAGGCGFYPRARNQS